MNQQRVVEMPHKSGHERLTFGTIRLSEGDTKSCLDQIAYSGKNGMNHVYHLVNSYTCTIFFESSETNPLTLVNSKNLIDGFWLRKYLELKTKGKVSATRGPNLFESAFTPELPLGKRHLLLGSTHDILDALETEIGKKTLNEAEVFKISPPFRELSDQEMDELVTSISSFGPDVIWVGLGTPKQDLFSHKISDRVAVPLVCVGAAFDFMSNNKKTAPIFMQRIGLEWLFRLASEPRRLWKRYLYGNLKFATLAWKDLLSK